jgi:hypothetical protein
MMAVGMRKGLGTAIKATMVASNCGCIKRDLILASRFANQYHKE